MTEKPLFDYRKADKKRHKWDDPAYCECGQEIEKVGPKDNIAEILLNGKIEKDCTDKECGMRTNIKLFVRESAVPWSDLYKLWQLGVDVFPAIEFEESTY